MARLTKSVNKNGPISSERRKGCGLRPTRVDKRSEPSPSHGSGDGSEGSKSSKSSTDSESSSTSSSESSAHSTSRKEKKDKRPVRSTGRREPKTVKESSRTMRDDRSPVPKNRKQCKRPVDKTLSSPYYTEEFKSERPRIVKDSGWRRWEPNEMEEPNCTRYGSDDHYPQRKSRDELNSSNESYKTGRRASFKPAMRKPIKESSRFEGVPYERGWQSNELKEPRCTRYYGSDDSYANPNYRESTRKWNTLSPKPLPEPRSYNAHAYSTRPSYQRKYRSRSFDNASRWGEPNRSRAAYWRSLSEPSVSDYGKWTE